MSDDDVVVLVCPWDHVTLWLGGSEPPPRECPARMHATDEWWGRCRRALTVTTTVPAIAGEEGAPDAG